MTEVTSVGGGEWKFRKDRITAQDLERRAERMSEDPVDGPRYLKLWVRQCSKDEISIGFLYEFPSIISESEWITFKHRVRDELREEFGEAKSGGAMSGYSLSYPIEMIK